MDFQRCPDGQKGKAMDQYFGSPGIEIDVAYYNKLDIRSFVIPLCGKDMLYGRCKSGGGHTVLTAE